MNEKISVITGASGHIGYALVKELEAQGDRFRILIRSESKIFDGISCEKAFGDVTDEASLEKAFAGADVVYHLAGIIDVSSGNKDLIWNVNVQGTKNVVEACKKCGVRRLVFASSVDAVKPKRGNEMMTEMTNFNPDEIKGMYGKTKAEATRYVLNSADENFEVVVIFPSACIGPYDFKVSSVGIMVRMIMRGRMPVSLNFGGYNFVDIRDVAKGMRSAAYKGRAGECYLLTGEVFTSDGIIRLIAETSGRKAPKIKLPFWLTSIFAPLAEVFYKISGASPVFTRISIEVINYNCNFCFAKAQKELGYNPMSIKQSVSDMIGWITKTEGITGKQKK